MPLYTDVNACNNALALVADDSAQITSIPATPNEKYSKEANLCSKFYPVTLLEVLAETQWKFARDRIALSLLETTPEFEWEFEFSLPADCVRPLACMPTQNTGRYYIYKAEWDIEDGKVVSNKDELWMLYTKNIENLNKATPLFFKTLYYALAVKLAMPLTEDRNLKNDLMNQYETCLLYTSPSPRDLSTSRMPSSA